MSERHPIPDAPDGKSAIERIHHLECHLARLWDQVWWMQLPFYRRWYYMAQGFRAPIKKFYIAE